MNDITFKILLVLCVLFAISMLNVLLYTYRRRKRWEERQNKISNEGYMKLYLQIENGKGEIYVESVDERPPLHSNEVIQRAIFLSPGEHKIRLSAKVKDNSFSEQVLPYQRNLGIFEVTVFAKKDGVAILCLDVNTHNIYMKEEEK